MHTPRLHSLVVENFRSIAGHWEVPLDAEIVLVHGSNGAGKTSLLSALELAATGDVKFLSSEQTLDQSLILNRHYPIGAVQLRVEDASGSMRSGGYEFDKTSMRGVPALDELERTFFTERSLLAQTQLGRFLETYTASSKQSDSSLVRFVKSLVGLEDLDSLIDGLHLAGHVSRTRNASERWTSTQQVEQRLTTERDTARRHLTDAQQGAEKAAELLRDLFTDDQDSSEDIQKLAADALRVEAADIDHELTLLEAIRVRLAGVRDSRTVETTSSTASTNAAALAARVASEYAVWERDAAPPVLAVVNEARARLFGLPAIATSRLVETFDDLRERVGEARTEQLALTSQHEERAVQRAKLEARIVEVAAEARASTDRIANIDLPPDVRVLIAALTAVTPAIQGDACPVCEKQYAGGAHALVAHVESKLGRLSSGARELLREETRNRELRDQLATLDRSLAQAGHAEDFDGVDYTPTLRRLNAMEETVKSGRSLLHSLQTSQAQLADLAARSAADEAAKRTLSGIRADLGEGPGHDSIEHEIERLGAVIDHRIADAQFQSAKAARLREAAQLAIDEVGRVRASEQRLKDLGQDLRAVQSALKEATARKDAANHLKKQTERIRSDVIGRVFDEKLNGLWAELFKRFAPAEPFTPRFRKQEEVSRFVDVKLETVLQSGEVGGSPGEMLSFGNSNTAAVSLFVALHLSAPSTVPWLVFDDPVQSMDDMHIANFATVVRQLAYKHNRQVVIAVHQRELFDYLAFELSPASPHQSLIKIEVERTNGATRVDWSRVDHRLEVEFLLAQ